MTSTWARLSRIGQQSKYKFFTNKQNLIYVDVCQILAHFIIEMTKFW